jgi:uracil-DNA glycosylase
VVYRGGATPRLVFVGEAPGAEEDRTGLPFQGRSGRRLDAAIAQIGLGATEYGIVNLLKCRPPGNRFDAPAARTCRPYLDRQLALLRPAALVPLGSQALRVVAPEAPPVLRAAGRQVREGPPAVFPLLHPAAALRSRRWAERWDEDVSALATWLAGAKPPYRAEA